ncbi:MAG: class I SAM-dependent methyltransferase [Spirochaetales bacterium]|nr:class I SAM-dependent methyltransferase [Spirochaetales bacterium]
MPDYKRIFEREADRYHELVAYEDWRNHLLGAIDNVCTLRPELVAADIGAGTGRAALLLATRVGSVHAVEPSLAMREKGLALARAGGIGNVSFHEGGYESLPLPDGSVDLVFEGWSLLYFYRLSLPDWRKPVARAWQEMTRICKPSGVIFLAETLGTALERPVRPDFAVPLYDHLEKELGCSHKAISTDYRFQTARQAAELIGWFFGEETGRRAAERGSPVVPEWTGVWWKKTQ